MSNILGLDLGTNSVGWALVDDERKQIVKAGSRIIPMDAATLSDYEKGNLQSAASERTGFRGMRRLYERAVLRRERLLRVLHVLGWLPAHYERQIDWDAHPGQFINHGEPLLPYRKGADGHSEFVFIDSFKEMLAEFSAKHPDMTANGKKIPYDWTIYWLRKKALERPVRREELAWIILNFNTKRGYYQLRGKDAPGEETSGKREEYCRLTVRAIVDNGPSKKKRGCHVYDVVFDNGLSVSKVSPFPPYQTGEQVELIVTTHLDKDGKARKTKEGKPMVTARPPKEDDWTLLKKRSEKAIDETHSTVGAYIFDNLLANPAVKVRGKLVRTIERSYYKEELRQIMQVQSRFLPELNDAEVCERCIRELYHHNEAHVKSVIGKGLADFIINDIIFYQRPLKSKKNEVANCPYESYHYINKETGEFVSKPVRCVSKSNPLYQEFRLWQFIGNLRIYQRQREENGKMQMDVDVTGEFITSADDVARLFESLWQKKDINQKQLLALLHLDEARYRWNHSEAKAFPCGETHQMLVKAMSHVKDAPVLSPSQEQELWHILYSVDDVIELRKALASFARKNAIEEASFVDSLKGVEPFKDDYGAFSEKAVKRLLPLMRCGRHWSEEAIDAQTVRRINLLLMGFDDDDIIKKLKKSHIRLQRMEDFQGLPTWLACYVVYGRHSEATDKERWETPGDIDRYLRCGFRQHALRNPVVEKVLGETLRVVRDVWKTYGKIDEVHVEMGRDLKAPAQERKRMTDRINDNERKNLRIRKLLLEFVKPQYEIEGIRPQSPGQQELLKIYEEAALDDLSDEVPDDIRKIANDLGSPSASVDGSSFMRYKLWLEQRYRSPYTGRVIPLSKLFTPAYEIEHVIPQSRWFDDSLSNKVICESEVNKLKDRMLGYEFIVEKGGSVIPANLGGTIRIFDKVQYEDFVKKHYAGNLSKMRKLLMDDIPDGFIERQMNDSRYIARQTIALLSKLVRDKGESEAVSKHVLASNGRITDRLKREWGINDVWNDIIAPRFERMNRLTGSNDYGSMADGKSHFQASVPLEESKGFSKKRLDHRHHAMDAIVIACTTRNHINFLNNAAARKGEEGYRHDLQHRLCEKVKTDANGHYAWRFLKPWPTFTQDVKTELQGIIVSFKQNLRVVNRMTNLYWHYVEGQKVQDRQTHGDGWSIRKPMHKATVSGAVRLQGIKTMKLGDALDNWHLIRDKEIRKEVRRVIGLYKGRYDKKTITRYFRDRGYRIGKTDVSKVEVWTLPDKAEHAASRVPLDSKFTAKDIEKVTDSGIRAILRRHLERYGGNTEEAFSPEGIAAMNRDIKELNNGRDHKPILKVRKFESFGMKFPIGSKGNKQQKFVEAAEGTLLFFAVYADEEGKRFFESISFRMAVENEKAGLPPAPDHDEAGHRLLFTISPGDLVYVPEEGEHVDIHRLDPERVWKMVSCSKCRCFFVPERVAAVIKDKGEYGSMNKVELTDQRVSIKNVCVKLKVNRLGLCE